MGVAVVEVDGVTIYWHGGCWGTRAAYVPSLDVAIGATVMPHQAWPTLGAMLQRARTRVRAAVAAQQAQRSTPAHGT
jgi:hypothetical protein